MGGFTQDHMVYDNQVWDQFRNWNCSLWNWNWNCNYEKSPELELELELQLWKWETFYNTLFSYHFISNINFSFFELFMGKLYILSLKMVKTLNMNYSFAQIVHRETQHAFIAQLGPWNRNYSIACIVPGKPSANTVYISQKLFSC